MIVKILYFPYIFHQLNIGDSIRLLDTQEIVNAEIINFDGDFIEIDHTCPFKLKDTMYIYKQINNEWINIGKCIIQ
jgi:hypothetical protein